MTFNIERQLSMKMKYKVGKFVSSDFKSYF